MPFRDFQGNASTVERLQAMLHHGRFPHACVLAGPQGAGKYTLALMLAQAMNCMTPTARAEGDFCGECDNCKRIAQSTDLDTLVDQAVETRDGLRETDKKETRIFVQTHPDVLVIPPDPPQRLIKVDQVRRVVDTIYYRPSAGATKVYIFTEAAFMNEAANSLLKVLEEPPEFAKLFLLATNPGTLLPTLRSRCMKVTLEAIPTDEIETFLARERPELTARQRTLVAQLANGALGRAKNFDLAAYVETRAEALNLLRGGKGAGGHSDLFKATEGFKSGAEGREKMEALLRVLFVLLEDLMYIQSGAEQRVRNKDVASDLKALGDSVTFDWIVTATDRLAEVERGMRRNLMRSLSLDAFALALEV